MDKKQFEKNARTLLKYGIGKNIEEAREKLQSLIIDAKEIAKRDKAEKGKNNEEKPNV